MNQSFWTTIQPLLAQGARDLLRTIGTYLLAKGIIQNDAGVTAFIGAGMTLAGIAWGWWTTSGYIIANNLLKKLTAKSSAAAAVTTAQALPPGAAVTKALALFAVLLASLCFALPAMAQTKTAPKPLIELNGPCNPLGDTRPQCNTGSAATPAGDQLQQLQTKIAALSLDDFKYALALSVSTNNTVTQPCWAAWVTLISQQQAPMKDAQGNVLTEPNPHIFTDVEKLAELINQLQPNSPISTGCAPMAQAAQKDIGNLIGAVISGGALGLVKLPFAIP
jgi:hypothetical protein